MNSSWKHRESRVMCAACKIFNCRGSAEDLAPSVLPKVTSPRKVFPKGKELSLRKSLGPSVTVGKSDVLLIDKKLFVSAI